MHKFLFEVGFYGMIILQEDFLSSDDNIAGRFLEFGLDRRRRRSTARVDSGVPGMHNN
jgi:hypothetical protein